MDMHWPKRSIFDHIDNNTQVRTGRYNIQWSSDKMIVNAIQQSIIDYNKSITAILDNSDETVER